MTQQTVFLSPDQIPEFLRSGYRGKMFKGIVTEQMTIPADAGLWDSGSRETYVVVRLADGCEYRPRFQSEAPWGSRAEFRVDLEPGITVIRHSIFCGKDMGLTFYVHPQDATKMLPSPCELSDLEKMILNSTSFKSSYAGRDRYQQTCDSLRYRPDTIRPTREQWEAAKVGLISRGFLNKSGAITIAGRNAREAKA